MCFSDRSIYHRNHARGTDGGARGVWRQVTIGLTVPRLIFHASAPAAGQSVRLPLGQLEHSRQIWSILAGAWGGWHVAEKPKNIGTFFREHLLGIILLSVFTSLIGSFVYSALTSSSQLPSPATEVEARPEGDQSALDLPTKSTSQPNDADSVAAPPPAVPSASSVAEEVVTNRIPAPGPSLPPPPGFISSIRLSGGSIAIYPKCSNCAYSGFLYVITARTIVENASDVDLYMAILADSLTVGSCGRGQHNTSGLIAIDGKETFDPSSFAIVGKGKSVTVSSSLDDECAATLFDLSAADVSLVALVSDGNGVVRVPLTASGVPIRFQRAQ